MQDYLSITNFLARNTMPKVGAFGDSFANLGQRGFAYLPVVT